MEAEVLIVNDEVASARKREREDAIEIGHDGPRIESLPGLHLLANQCIPQSALRLERPDDRNLGHGNPRVTVTRRQSLRMVKANATINLERLPATEKAPSPLQGRGLAAGPSVLATPKLH